MRILPRTPAWSFGLDISELLITGALVGVNIASYVLAFVADGRMEVLLRFSAVAFATKRRDVKLR